MAEVKKLLSTKKVAAMFKLSPQSLRQILRNANPKREKGSHTRYEFEEGGSLLAKLSTLIEKHKRRERIAKPKKAKKAKGKAKAKAKKAPKPKLVKKAKPVENEVLEVA